jgi:hypothetical protein
VIRIVASVNGGVNNPSHRWQWALGSHYGDYEWLRSTCGIAHEKQVLYHQTTIELGSARPLIAIPYVSAW